MSKIDRRTANRKVGDMGEEATCVYLKRKGYQVITRNYLKKWGEIDIISKKGSVLHFVEVKSVSCVTLDHIPIGDTHRPEDNMHPWKLKRLARTVQTYLLEEGWEGEWQLDLAVVYLDRVSRQAKVRVLENIVF